MTNFKSVFDKHGRLIASSFKVTTTRQVEFYDFRNKAYKRVSIEHFTANYTIKLLKCKRGRGKK